MPAVSLSFDDEMLELVWGDGTSSRFHHLWLRDSCPCEACLFYELDERRHLISELDLDVHALDASLVDDKVVVAWSDGHRSELRCEWLRTRDYGTGNYRAHAVAPVDPTLWTAGDDHIVHRFAADELRSDDAVLLDALGRLRDVGVFVATGLEADGLESFAEHHAPLRICGGERIHEVSVRGDDAYNVAHTDQALPPHTDFPSYHWPPSVQFLHMVVNDCAGGDSIVVDGWNVVAQLQASDPDAIRVLETVAVPWREFSAHFESYSKAPVIERDGYGRLQRIRYSNQLLQPPDAEPDLMREWYSAFGAFGKLATDPANQLTFRLNAGDVLCVHSRRVLHARMAFTASGPRHLRDAYLDFDDICGRIAVLERERDARPTHAERR